MSRNLVSRIIKVEGMTDAECERRITERLKGLDGVRSAGASASSSEVYITYDSNRTSLSSIMKALEETGCAPRTGATGEGAGNRASQTAEVVLAIEGMTCTGCESRIQNGLKKTTGVLKARVSFESSKAIISYDPGVVTPKALIQAVENLGYRAKKPAMDKNAQDGGKPMRINQLLGIGIIALAVYLVINNTVGFNFLPQIDRNMGYGMLFAVGLVTSLHCVAMCGGINLSQCVSYRQPEAGGNGASKIKPSLMYNMGRVLSYTMIGGIVGGLGTVVSFSGAARGIVAVISGAFMIIVGLNMLNAFPWLRKINPRLPKAFSRLAQGGKGKKGPFIVGLLNGLMPCGPLQAMQLYALGTGSVLAGALSMFMFSLGTTPMMFGLGAASSFLTGKFTHKMMKASAVLVMVLGLIMVNRGLSLSGINVASALSKDADNIAVIEGDVQTVTSTLRADGYEPVMVQKGIPVRWNIKAGEKDLNGCNNSIIIPKYGIRKNLVPGDNIVEFTPDEEGNVIYTCWMGMIRSNIQVVSDLSNVSHGEKADLLKPGSLPGDIGGGCCGW